MITQWVMQFLHTLATAVFSWASSLIPAPPAFWTDANDAVTTALALVPSSVRYFVPIGPVITAALAVAGMILVLGFIRLGRRVLSLFTGGGGMA